MILNASVAIIPLTLALTITEIGSVLAFTGSISGFIIIYTLPVAVYLKKRYKEITNPLLVEAIDRNESSVTETTRKETDTSRHNSHS